MSVRQSFSTCAKSLYSCSDTPGFCLFCFCFLYVCLFARIAVRTPLSVHLYISVRQSLFTCTESLYSCSDTPMLLFFGMYAYSCKSSPVVVVFSVCLFASRLPTYTTCLYLCCKVSLSSHRTQGEASQKSTDSQASWGDNRSYRGVHKMAR